MPKDLVKHSHYVRDRVLTTPIKKLISYFIYQELELAPVAIEVIFQLQRKDLSASCAFDFSLVLSIITRNVIFKKRKKRKGYFCSLMVGGNGPEIWA